MGGGGGLGRGQERIVLTVTANTYKFKSLVL